MNAEKQVARNINSAVTYSLEHAVALGYVRKQATGYHFTATGEAVPEGATEVRVNPNSGAPATE